MIPRLCNPPAHLPARLAAAALLVQLAWPAQVMAQAVKESTTQADIAPQDWDLKYQSTYNWQKHAGYGAAYSGPNSLLRSGEKMYTFSATAHAGVRLWAGAEAYANVEVVQGVPFSTNLVGLGGFTNGEITRAAGTNPSVYRQRLFLRQTWNQGGGSEAVESDFNQLAGSRDRNRVVLTAGSFSTLDIFDGNEYAKDPRTQFMNWSHWTYGAYDYAADARGFGWGFALEWYSGDWALRAGRMTGPRVPNGLPVDFSILRHYGDQVEIEHSHELGGQPGKLRLLAYHNRAVLAAFDDATRYLQQNPGADPQAILQVRKGEKDKYGIGVNVEQQLARGVGFFLRAMKTDGRTETYAFTEIDNSLSGGFAFQGSRWGRPEDSAGLALAVNGLSAQRRRYLEAGGISFFIGDGALRYRPETILEGYYSWQFSRSTALTLGYQRIQNPAYNAARGPVNVIALRLHAEL